MAKKTEIRILIDTDYLKKLKNRVNISNSTEIIKQALGIYEWITTDIENDRIIGSVSKTGRDIHRLVSPEFLNILKIRKENGNG